ncbi:hypothetical protein [Actinomadura sp. 3N508]|uniref:hypothetical protein n=1 Tax=Actinomadura sp. 3N508 TaxID=3375153 RepID=UPI0037B7CAC0
MIADASGAAVMPLAQQDPLDGTGGRLALIFVLLIVLAGLFVAGLMAFTGRWRSWYSDSWRANYKPLAAPWFAGALLLMAALVGLNFLLDPAPAPVLALGSLLAMAGIIVTGIYAIHPPRRMLPRWIRAIEDDPLGPEARAEPALDETLSSWKSKWERSALRNKLMVGVLCVAIPLGLFYLARPLWWYATGTSTTAVVERCVDPGREQLQCAGRWTLPDGENVRGDVAGAGRGDVGQSVKVRATTSHAAKLTLRLLYGPLLMLLVIAVLGYTSYRQYRQRSRRRAGQQEAPPS